ncbi:MAG: glutathione S-transferase, partial [Granulosicoccaceae bacterium]
MSNYKLTYFDIDGGRGEPLRITLHAAGLAFEDIRWSFPEFGEKRESARFHAVPFLEIDGQPVTQSNALCRYIGKMCNLYPTDPMQALYCDEVIEAIEDLTHYIVQTFGLEGEKLKKARENFMNKRLTVFLNGLNELLTRGGGQYFANNGLTIADLKVAAALKSMRNGGLEHIPADFVDKIAPALAKHQDRVENDPIVLAYR